MAHLLIVDDDTNTLASLARAFRLAGHEATICDNAARVRAIHPAAAAFDPARSHLDPGGPLHEGAARYFEVRGGIRS